MKKPAINNFNAESVREWATSVEWLGLQIVHSSFKGIKGYPHAGKIGRNNSCYCGSGKKYKVCCQNKK